MKNTKANLIIRKREWGSAGGGGGGGFSGRWGSGGWFIMSANGGISGVPRLMSKGTLIGHID